MYRNGEKGGGEGVIFSHNSYLHTDFKWRLYRTIHMVVTMLDSNTDAVGLAS